MLYPIELRGPGDGLVRLMAAGNDLDIEKARAAVRALKV